MKTRRAQAESAATPWALTKSVSAAFHLDLLGWLLGLRLFRQRHLQHAVLERSLDLLRFDGLRQAHRADERAETSLPEVKALLFLDLVLFLLPLDRQHAVGDVNLDIFCVEPQHLGRQLESTVALDQIHRRLRSEERRVG